MTKSPVVTIGTRPIKYMLSFAVPRFCDQSLDRSRKERFYPGELYHIDPELAGIRRIEKEDGTYSANCHGQAFFEQVADMVHAYVASGPSPEIFDFLRDDFKALESKFDGVVGTSFRTFPRSIWRASLVVSSSQRAMA